MADPNAEVFNFAAQTFSRSFSQAAGAQAARIKDEIQGYLRDYMKEFYALMFAGVEDYAAQEGYADLHPTYWDDKIVKRGEAPAFWRFSDDLETSLTSRNPIRDLGTPLATFSQSSPTLNRNIKLDSRGRPQFVAGSGRVGFASFEEAFRKLTLSVDIQLFGQATGQSYSAIIKRMLPKVPNSLRIRLSKGEFGSRPGAKRYQPARPLLRPHMEWFGGPFLRESLKRQFGVDVR